MPTLPRVTAADHDAIATALREHGACRIAGLPPARATAALRDDLRSLLDDGALTTAATGRGDARSVGGLRGDRTLWLDDPRCGAAARAHLAAMQVLATALNRRLFLGIGEVEAHYAVYPPGAGYARHRDRFRDSDDRVVSLASYLNEGWQAGDGGDLRLHLDTGSIDIAPAGGSSVCFLSDIEHEVLPATRERLSIAGWLRRRA